MRKKSIKAWKRGKRGEKQTEILDYAEKPKEKKTYPQKWHEYNLSQTSEKLLFLNMLRDICSYIKYNKPPRKGRPSLDYSEMIYCMCMMIYHKQASRRTISELILSKERGDISHVPNFNSILNYFKNEKMTGFLQSLIQLSSYPLKNIELDFAIDSSGFSTSVFEPWSKFKWGKKGGKERTWAKMHVMSGVKTNIITSVKVERCADVKKFKELVLRTNEIFEIREVSADKAYMSRDNYQVVSDIGGVAFIPFRKGTRRMSRGRTAWTQMRDYFYDHYDDFKAHYHKRSNAETVFAMIKRKLGINLRTKSDQGHINEILCRALCHNLIVLIHELFESGVASDFEICYTELHYGSGKKGSAQKIA